MDLDLSFLNFSFTDAVASQRAVNVYDILREGWRESRVDMTLQFFLDPTERHGLGSMVMDALLNCLDGAPTIGPPGSSSRPLPARDYLESQSWEIGMQIDFMDVLATNSDLDIAIVIENKIGHELNNPLDRYARTALDLGFRTVAVAVLAPEARPAPGGLGAWLSRSITYAELAAEIKKAPALVDALLSPASQDQHRSLELLQQFIEARSGSMKMGDLAAESRRLDEWRACIKDHESSIAKFDDARRAISKTLRERSRRLAEPIGERLAEAGLEVSWEAHGNNPRGSDFWNAYCFAPEDWSIELKLSASPSRPVIYVYDYRGRTYKDATFEPLGVEWTASDDEIADAFIARITAILEQVRTGTR